MAKPNYSFEKRQRDLAKQRKKEEKLKKKADRKDTAVADTPDGNAAVEPEAAGLEETAE